ncbi:uncharacterized protein LOC129713973 [Leucoraja erinacea]|uniref:uncharacterized protein LOC129713973 n=1 Tax=Leucoraja erinaceus TaxID=7782 RepID=UPI0024558E90|nr:uncharacterized protein LOC129713973 [Leucoraja erinacea]XP_055519385.1 uncharacterized protein LOC129713973 [Leucoraja erinacea]
MKFSHVCPTSSVKKQRVSLKELIATFLVLVSLAGSIGACNFEWGKSMTNSYNDSIKKLRDILPTDYNLTVYLPNSTGMASCCLNLQALLSLNRSLSHLHRNSVFPLQNLVTTVINEMQVIKDCPVKESSNCQVMRWNSTHLLKTLHRKLQSFDAEFDSKQCDFSVCVLHTCSPGQGKAVLTTAAGSTVTSMGGLDHFTGGADLMPMTAAVPTSPSAVTIPPSPSGCTPPSSLPNGTHSPPASSSGNNPDPSAVNGSAANMPDANPSTTTGALNNASTVGNGCLATSTSGHGPEPSSANASLTNGTNAGQANVSQTSGDDQSQANSTSPNQGTGKFLASVECLTEEVSTPRSRMATVVMMVSVLANAILLGCLLRKRRRQAAAQMTEMEPLASVGVELWTERQWSRS